MSVAQPIRSGTRSGSRRMTSAWLSAGLGAAGPVRSVNEQPADTVASVAATRAKRRTDSATKNRGATSNYQA